jgi:transcriptional regulator with XRE-family HTH domain
MTGLQLRQYRRKNRLTQQEAARSLGVSQGYLSLLEKEHRPLSEELKKKLVASLDLPVTELPSNVSKYKVGEVSDDQLTADLAALGYPGFSHYKPSRPKNPADVLLAGLKANKRDARVVEAFPWLLVAFPAMDRDDLVATAKVYDLQNRLGFVANVASGVAEALGDKKLAAALQKLETRLEPSRLEREDTLCNETMTNTERNWLSTNRPEAAKRWHLLTDHSPRYLDHYVRYDDGVASFTSATPTAKTLR